MAFGYYKSVTLSEAQSGTADSTDWPLTISLDGNVQAADADLKTVGNGGYVQNANGYDIRPYSDSGLTTALTYELVFYDATTGKLEMHVKIPTLSTSTDTVIYLAFGDSGISTDGSSNTTWESNFKRVIHLSNGSSLSVADSSQSAGSITNHGATATSGQMDGGADLAGTSEYVDLGGGDGTELDIPGAVTLSWWATYDSFTDYPYGISNYNSGGNVSQYGIYVDEITSKPTYGLNAGPGLGYKIWAGSAISTGTRYHVVATHNGNLGDSDVHIYINGSDQSLTTGGPGVLGGMPTSGMGNTSLGRGGDYDGDYLNGMVDEARIATTVRSQSWVTADYNSQKASSTFITWGSRTTVSAGSSQGEGYFIITS